MKTIKYILTLLIAVLLTATSAWGAITPIQPANGDGSAANPYQISSAKELWGFAAIVNGTNGFTQNLSANAVLTDDIDMGGEANGSFPGIAPHLGSGEVYKGTFNGQGHKITGFYMSTTSNRSGLFSATNNATIKNFSISGSFIVSSNHTMCGVIVGDIDPAGATTLVEDIDCDVTITCNNASASRIGGIAGCVTRPGSIINRCRYHGTITGNGVTEGIGGIAGDVRGGIIKNSLFDGTITTTASAPKIGGIFGKRGESVYGKMVIQDCLVIGDNIPNTGSYCGAIIGYHTSTGTNTNTIKNCYYTTNNSLNPVASGASYITFDPSTNPVNVIGSEDLTNGTLKANLNNGDNNWKQGTNYPIPGVESTYTITFESDGGSAVASVTTTAGASVSAPTSPTKTGYDFACWVDSDGNTVTFPFTMPAANVTLTATWTLATFHVNYYVDNALYQSVPVKYTEAITPLDAPTKERYTFSGWSTIPATMPAEDVRVDGTFTYTANAEGIYEIGTKEDFFNFATVVSTTPAASAKLIDDIDLENTEFSGFGKNETGKFYSGTFDGQGHTISNFTRTCTTGNGSGFFNAIDNATVKDFTLEGNITFSFSSEQYYNSSVVAYMTGTSKIEDVHSKVNATMTNGKTRLYGGILGRGSGTVNRCRYSGTVSASTSYDQIAGICASANGLTISNCLFDGSITSESTNANLCIGGIVAKTNVNGNSLSNNLVNGTISPSSSTYALCGVVIGNASNTISMDRCYYVGIGSLPAVGTATNAKGTATLVDPSAEGFKWSDIKISLGESNWVITSELYPIPGEGTAHVHAYTNGFCLCGGYEAADLDDEVYQIDNAGKLFWFAQQISDGGIAASSKATLTQSIDLESREFPGIGAFISTSDYSKAYSGTFDGQGYTISGYNRKVTSGNQQGFFNYAKGATIKAFTLEGTMTDSGNGQQHGSVVGWADEGTTIEDVHSAVDVTITGTAAQVGGFAGRAGGTFNRCSYSGTVTTATAYDKVGGFAGCLRDATVKNCLYDGQLNISTNNDGLKAGGFAGAVIEMAGSMSHCLVNGTVDITNKTSNCGVVVGLADRNTTFSMVLYTTTDTNGLTAAVGSVNSSYKLTGTATDVTSVTWGDVNIMLNPTEGTEGNWAIKTGDGAKTYPVPSTGEWTHAHKFTANGFCISDDHNYQAATQAQDGYWEVDNAGKLWWVMTNVNNGTQGLNKKSRIRLTADIDMEGEARGSWPGFCPLGSKTVDGATVDDWTTAYQGIFDGNKMTITNYYCALSSGLRRGFFNTLYGEGKVKKFTIEGKLQIANSGTEAALVGVAVGHAVCEAESGQPSIEDIHSKVTITLTNGIARGLGGVVGALEDKSQKAGVTINRCRYNGTLTAEGTQNKNFTDVGGVAGELRSATMKNCLYDGTITVGTGINYAYIGGLVGKVTNLDNSEIHRSMSHGTFSLADYEAATHKSGILVGGCADKTLYLYRCFHTRTNTGALTDYIGPHTMQKKVTSENDGNVGETITVDLTLGESTDMTDSLDSLYTDRFRTLLGEPNWAEVEETEGQYTYPLKDEGHIHRYSNGFCTSGDGEYEKANSMGKIYQIDNGGKLYWFATQFNRKAIPQDVTVYIMNNIDLEGDSYTYPGIGTTDYRFKGTFNGQDFVMRNYHRDIVNAEGTGLINYAEGATIERFSLYGDVNFNLPTVKSFHGTVLGMGTNEDSKTHDNPKKMMISDVYSYVNVYCKNANTRVLGGIAGRTSGTLKRSRYGGTIEGMDHAVSASGRQIGGLVANAREEILIEDCLFDGTIRVTCAEADTMRVSGILASNEKRSGVLITIKNCLFNGCLELKHTYVQSDADKAAGLHVKSTENGIIAGYWDSSRPKLVNNVYYLNACPGTGVADLGKFEGLGQKEDDNTINTTEIKPTGTNTEPTPEEWNEIFKALDEYHIETDKDGNEIEVRNNNWVYSAEHAGTGGYETLPVPGGHKCTHVNEDGSSAYNEFGYCTICGQARPLTIDTDGKYVMEYVSDLAGFRDLINSGTAGDDQFNAKLTADIDFANFEGDFGEPIGNSHFNRYLYNFDGQGHKMLNVKIKTDDEYVGFFGFAGDKSHDCYIHDFTITGTIEAPYDSKTNDDKPLYMGVVGKMFRGRIENVHSELTMTNTSATRARIGGILGAAESEAEGDYNVQVSKCSYTGTCSANAVGNMGGIVGETSYRTLIDHCTFAGTMDHTYEGGNNTTNFGGVVGYNEDASFQGVQRCVIAGVLKTDGGRTFVNYGQTGNHKNILSGEDRVITNGASDAYKARYKDNYSWNVYYADPVVSSSPVQPIYVTGAQLAFGNVCAIMNGLETNHDAQDGYPWGQVLGYQMNAGYSSDPRAYAQPAAEGHYEKDTPARRYPLPGYQNDEKKPYMVTKDASGNYTADWYHLDDKGDATPFPEGATSLKARKVDHTRTDMKGFCSMCLPISFTEEMKPYADARAYIYKETNGAMVSFREARLPIAAGTPFILEYSSPTADSTWTLVAESTTGMTMARSAKNPTADAPGIYGALETTYIGAGYWKLHPDGTQFVQTNGADQTHGPKSYCYPYRVYMKLDSGGGVKEYVPVFASGEVELTGADDEEAADGVCYNTMGQRVSKNAKGIVIVNGRKYLRK